MSKPRLEDLPECYQRQALDQLAKIIRPRTIAQTPLNPLPAEPISRPSLRQRTSDGLNKLERAFLGHLEAHKLGPLLTQAITLKLANGVRYTPDFVEVRYSTGLIAYEVKGFMRDDAAVKIKVAASLYPWITFFLATRPRGASAWRIERIYANEPNSLPRAPIAPHLGPQD